MRGIRLSRDGEELSSVHIQGGGIKLVKGQVMILNGWETQQLCEFLTLRGAKLPKHPPEAAP
jgi:hypothetical protein